ncbi:hypothetical protein GCM10027597_26430 [Saccharopolyspora tripterygii]
MLLSALDSPQGWAAGCVRLAGEVAAIRVVVAAGAVMGMVHRRSRAGRSVLDVRCVVIETGSFEISGRRRRQRGVGVRFAFYGRMSTREFQHREVAEATIAGCGVVVEEFFR